ncbi:CDP-glucose 4,6-dehydratase [Paenibacillus sp. V4I7]|uniref:CDP-glucose 4,6-dehydratase n=1 Tax=Paenibacillus sp. V4I7 TaxID=3042307 RepID=UPI0027888A79|nr:CDP-glucose 4,6-dehydratase [Paenibacillus sp. V4I7]MDQ0903910.1 CDP-glucose 4,6-dehydratase [Paenibacillus sp. V4I7]
MINQNFWKNKRVFVTGHTGFKGSWLSLWLNSMGANITGYALNPPTKPSLYEICEIDQLVNSNIGDVRDYQSLYNAMSEAQPEIVIHMAAQPLVRDSYKNPVDTYSINVMGTVNLLESIRNCKSVRAVVNVTTDKCYENKEWPWGYRENEPLGGYDPYSNSKACSELVTSSYRNSFFNPKDYEKHGVGIASARAGNVIGGGDWAADRLIPDCIRSLLNNQPIIIRNPHAIRPWQHVLEPLSGYLLLAQRLYEDGASFSEGWNFGPNDEDAKSVEWIVSKMCTIWGNNSSFSIDEGNHPHEAHYLKLDCSKAKTILGWYPKWNLEQTLKKVISWVEVYKNEDNLMETCLKQIDEYIST